MTSRNISKTAMEYGWKAGNLPAGIPKQRRGTPRFDALTSTAHQLQQLMKNGELKSTDLVEEYIWRIEKYNPYLRAISDYAPGAMAVARDMDAKRAAGEILGPLHGIPVLLKNTFNTHPDLGMETTASAFAFLGNKPARNAEIVDKLIAAGAVIIAKASISELSFWKGSGLVCGWSSMEGQGQTPYVRGGYDPTDTFGGHSVPGGSSSGVANALGAGLCAIGVGSDTEASITAPAMRASLYSLRPTVGIISTKGAVPVSRTFDTPGPMAKDPQDVADLLSALVDRKKASIPISGFAAGTAADWPNIKVGTLDPTVWNYPAFLCKPVPEATEQMLKATEDAYTRIKALAGKYQQHVELPDPSTFMFNGGHSVYDMIGADFRDDINAYLEDLSESKVRSVKQLVEWNLEHADIALPTEGPSQELLVKASEEPQFSKEQLVEIRNHYQATGSKFDELLKKYDLDIIIGPGDCWLTQYASANGYPIAAMPLAYLDFNGRAIGLQAMAAAHQEQTLLTFMGAYEDSFHPRKPPTGFEAGAEALLRASTSQL